MTLHAPSRTSFAFRSFTPGRQTTAIPSLQTSSRRIWCPFGAPNPRNPLPGAASSPEVGRRLSPSVYPGRPTSARAPVVRRTSSRGSIPASVRLRRFPRPWRFPPPRARWSVSSTHAPGVLLPAPRCLFPVDGPEDPTSRNSTVCCVPMVRVTRYSGGECSLRRFPVDSAPDSCRNSHPSCEVTAPPPEEGGPASGSLPRS